MKKSTRNAFTLIEVLIVVVIMAVLAATIIPQFSSSVEESKTNQMSFNLHTLRSQIEMFRVQHAGVYPKIDDNLEVLYKKTNASGAVDSSGTYGPYVLEALPVNPLTNTNTVSASTDGVTKAGGGWLYNATTGEIWADGKVAAQSGS